MLPALSGYSEDLARWLMEQGIESVSLNPDSVLDTWFFLAEGQDQA
ncbi:hypothetical protein LDY98_27000 [Pseudomonas aeruginosa]|nr:hypothetical protein [Pseudomonas aeruginosa]